MIKLKPYKKYKPSGVEWLGDIPEGWEVRRVKDLIKIKNGSDYKDIESEEGYPVFGSGGQFTYATKFIHNGESILFGRKGTINKPLYINEAFWTVDTMFYSLIYKKVFGKFVYYFSVCIPYFSHSTQTALPSMTQRSLEKILLSVPSKQIQILISNYLDEKTAKIDEKIKLLKDKKEKYQEFKKSLINETVCRGIDKNVKLKDSGIEWIGKIPEGWEVSKFKDCCNVFTGNSIADKEMFLNENNSYPYIATKDININTQHINYSNGIYVSKSDKKFKIAKEYSTLLCIEGASAGKKIAYTDRKVCFVNKLCAITSINQKISGKFSFYFLRSLLFKNQFFCIINGLIGGVSVNLIKNFNVIIPPEQEQEAISNYLDKKTAKIDEIISTIDIEINKLAELRKTLINDVVTGKVKVV